jgi:hypothetical protein
MFGQRERTRFALWHPVFDVLKLALAGHLTSEHRFPWNLLMDLGDRAAGFRFPGPDRAGQFTASFDAILADAAIEANQVRDGQQAPGSEGTPARRDDHERVRRRNIGPGRRKREQLPGLVPAVDPVLTPVAPADNELEIAAGQRMEPVSYPDTAVPIIWIGCSRRRRPTLTRNGSCSPPGPRSPTGCSSSVSGICGRSWPSMSPITTGGDLIAAASSARPGPITLPADLSKERIRRRPVLGGLINEYEWTA